MHLLKVEVEESLVVEMVVDCCLRRLRRLVHIILHCIHLYYYYSIRCFENINTLTFILLLTTYIYRRLSGLPMEGEVAKAKGMISPRTSLLLLDCWEEEEGRELVDGETYWPRFWKEK